MFRERTRASGPEAERLFDEELVRILAKGRAEALESCATQNGALGEPPPLKQDSSRSALIASAEKSVQKGKVDAAVRDYLKVLEETPNDINILNKVGDLYVRLGKNDESIPHFLRIAEFYVRDGFYVRAIAMYKKVNRLDPARLDIYERLAELYVKQQLWMEAKSNYQVLADYLLKQDNLGGAIGIYQKMVAIEPQNLQLHVKLADLFTQGKRIPEALREYGIVAAALAERGAQEESIRVYEKALTLAPDDVEILRSLVPLLLSDNSFERARSVLRKGLDVSPRSVPLFLLAADAALAANDMAEARKFSDKARAVDPMNDDVLSAVVRIQLRGGRPDLAWPAAEPLADAAVRNGEAKKALGILVPIANAAPDLDDFDDLVKKIVEIASGIGEEATALPFRSTLAELYRKKGKFAEAADLLRHCVRGQPDNAGFRSRLAQLEPSSGFVSVSPPGVSPPTVERQPGATLPPFNAPPATATPGFVAPATTPPQPLAESHEALPAALPFGSVRPSEAEGSAIDEALFEADVFRRYGLAAMAVDRLRPWLERAPEDLRIREKLFEVFLEQGHRAQAREQAEFLAEAYGVSGRENRIRGLEGLLGEPLRTAVPADTKAHSVFDKTAPHRLTLRNPEPWAVEWGDDDYGIFASVRAFDVIYRMRLVAPGRFVMGSPETERGRYDNEEKRPVTVRRAFWLGETPCTQALWKAVMGAEPSRFVSSNRPVENVSVEDCVQFCERLDRVVLGFGARLPTEIEWEYACRGGTSTATWAGDLSLLGTSVEPRLDPIAWYAGNSGMGFDLHNGVDSRDWFDGRGTWSRSGTHAVGQKHANPYGLYDMLGNVNEWCADRYAPYGGMQETVLASKPSITGYARVIRGGSWASEARDVRAACRALDEPDYRGDDVGFRLACNCRDSLLLTSSSL